MKHIHINRTRFLKYLSLAIFILVLVNCKATIDKIMQPSTAKVNDVINVKLNTTWENNTLDALAGRQIVLGILAPKGWKLGQSGNTTIEVSSYRQKSKMSLIPLSTVAAGATNSENWPTLFRNKFGIGPNYIDDMEWVTFVSDAKMIVEPSTTIAGTFDISMKVGSDNRNASVRLGYVICNFNDGLMVDPTQGSKGNYWDDQYADCMSITGGQGDVIDYCNPALTYLTPAKVLDNEYVTILFDGTVAQTKLAGADNVYLCATAHTTDNQDIVVCSPSDKTKMVKVADNKYNITFWPKGYFNVPQGKTLASIDYYITDKTGNIKVGYANTSSPFKLPFACE